MGQGDDAFLESDSGSGEGESLASSDGESPIPKDIKQQLKKESAKSAKGQGGRGKGEAKPSKEKAVAPAGKAATASKRKAAATGTATHVAERPERKKGSHIDVTPPKKQAKYVQKMVPAVVPPPEPKRRGKAAATQAEVKREPVPRIIEPLAKKADARKKSSTGTASTSHASSANQHEALANKLTTPIPPKAGSSQGAAGKSFELQEVPLQRGGKRGTTPQIIPTRTDIDMERMKRESKKVLPWVDKYAPKSLDQLAGLQGDQSAMRKLLRWLMDWPKHNVGARAKVKKARPGPFSKGDGSAFKAALLHGAPGIGKTTTAVLCCEELNLAYRETNASVTRNKKAMAEIRASSESIEQFLTRGRSDIALKEQSELRGVQHVLIMDEVDGLAGNEDRMGMSELIQLIKRTRVPIICICNNRQKKAIRQGLAYYCYDIVFRRPRVEQIKALLERIVEEEGVSIGPEALDSIIEASHHDIRQCIHALQLYASGLPTDERGEVKRSRMAASALPPVQIEKKDVPPASTFDAAHDLLTAGNSLLEKQELFFEEYAWMPLFVHENYPAVQDKEVSETEMLRRVHRAADSISKGDLAEKLIRSHQAWSLLPDQGMLSCVLPALFLNGRITKKLEFPQWIGKNSTAQKRQRLLRELAVHTYSKFACSNHALVEDYLPMLRERIYGPLVEEGSAGVKDALDYILHYKLKKEDLDAMNDLGAWPPLSDGSGQKAEEDVYAYVSTGAKSALTKALNQEKQLLTVRSTGTIVGALGKKGRGKQVVTSSEEGEGEEAEGEEGAGAPALEDILDYEE